MDSLPHLDAYRACMHDYRASRGEKEPLDQLHASGVQTEYVPRHEIEARITLEQALRRVLLSRQGRVWSRGAVYILQPLLSHRIEEYVSAPYVQRAFSVRLCMQAHSIAAYAYYKTYIAMPEDLRQATIETRKHQHRPHLDNILCPDNPLEAILRAVQHANIAASMQFLSPVVFTVGFALRDLAERVGLDVWHLKSYAPLWRTLERYELELFEEKSLPGGRSGQMMIMPGQTMCAARGCTKSAELVPCSGNCAWQSKPWYCSLTCQTEDWEGHREMCKPPRMRAPTELPPAITLDRPTYYTLLRALTPTGDISNVEIVPVDVNPVDTRNGVVGQSWKMPSPYVLGETVQYVIRHYSV